MSGRTRQPGRRSASPAGAGTTIAPRLQWQGEASVRKSTTKRRASNVVLIVLLVAGFSLLLYPTVSNLWNSMNMSKAIVDYSEEVSELDTEQYVAFWERAERYNQELAQDPDRFEMNNSERADYESQLRVSDTGIMGSIDIPSLGVSMPIYHGTEESVLQVGAGHIEGSSLPTGGKGTHCALSGHRGLPSSKLFTDIDKLEVGDTFVLNVLDRTLTYEVDQILTVDPYDMEPLAIDPEQDYCTLVTCTPYGINTHRLLVRGHRVANRMTEDTVTHDTTSPTLLMAGAGMAMVAAGIALRVASRRRG